MKRLVLWIFGILIAFTLGVFAATAVFYTWHEPKTTEASRTYECTHKLFHQRLQDMAVFADTGRSDVSLPIAYFTQSDTAPNGNRQHFIPVSASDTSHFQQLVGRKAYVTSARILRDFPCLNDITLVMRSPDGVYESHLTREELQNFSGYDMDELRTMEGWFAFQEDLDYESMLNAEASTRKFYTEYVEPAQLSATM